MFLRVRVVREVWESRGGGVDLRETAARRRREAGVVRCIVKDGCFGFREVGKQEGLRGSLSLREVRPDA